MLVPPLTFNRAEPEVVPIPTFPELLILTLSTPPSVKAMVSAAGKKMPVLVSPSLVMDGAAADPSAKLATPVTFNDVTVPPTVDADCHVLPLYTRSSLAVVLKYWSPVVSALPSLSTVGSLALAPR